MRKAHALHNEALCEFLLHNGNYNDWVITTAFYSALNYVKFEMFPLHISGVGKFEDFEMYLRKQDKSGEKHYVLMQLVSRYMKCGGAYRWLLENCMTARYSEYIVSEANARHARRMLAYVKESCQKLTPPELPYGKY